MADAFRMFKKWTKWPSVRQVASASGTSTGLITATLPKTAIAGSTLLAIAQYRLNSYAGVPTGYTLDDEYADLSLNPDVRESRWVKLAVGNETSFAMNGVAATTGTIIYVIEIVNGNGTVQDQSADTPANTDTTAAITPTVGRSVAVASICVPDVTTVITGPGALWTTVDNIAVDTTTDIEGAVFYKVLDNFDVIPATDLASTVVTDAVGMIANYSSGPNTSSADLDTALGIGHAADQIVISDTDIDVGNQFIMRSLRITTQDAINLNLWVAGQPWEQELTVDGALDWTGTMVLEAGEELVFRATKPGVSVFASGVEVGP